MKKTNKPLEEPEIPLDFLGKFNSNWINLFYQISELMTDEMIWSIAKADYGCEKDFCFNQFKKILETKTLPLMPDFTLTECLELKRWSKAKDDKEHVIRAFSSMLLIILANQSKYIPVGDENDTLIALLDSVLYLKLDFKPIQELIIWRILSDYEKEKRYYIEDNDIESIDEIVINEFFIYTLLLAMISNAQKQEDVEVVANWLLEMDKYNKNLLPYYSKEREKHLKKYNIVPKDFILNTTNHNHYHHLWKEVSKKMLPKIKYIKQEVIYIKLENIIKSVLN